MAGARIGDRMEQLRIDRQAAKAPPFRRRRLFAALALLLLSALAAAWFTTRPIAVQTVQIRLARPGEEATELTASGYVAAKRRSIIAPQIPGRLEEVLVQEGEHVEQGQIIARLDAADAEVALLQARARERLAGAELRNAEERLRKARRDFARTEKLAASGAAARSSLDDARTGAQAALATLNAAHASLAAAGEGRAAAGLQLEHTIVRAPFDGTIVRKIADEGSVLAPAAITASDVGGIVEMVDLSTLEVEAEVSEEQLGRIEIGQPALVFLDAWPDRIYRARAASVRPAIDRAKATAVVKVDFVDPPAGALPDMGARIAFLESPLGPAELEAGAGLRVPSSAIVHREGEGPFVFVVEDGRARPIPVTIDHEAGGEMALAAGPEAGTPVIAAPGPRLHPGARVRVQEQEQEPA